LQLQSRKIGNLAREIILSVNKKKRKCGLNWMSYDTSGEGKGL